MRINYRDDLIGVDWSRLKQVLFDDDFDNGRTPHQLQRSFEQSYATCLAYADEECIGTARVLSDGVCNAYVVDVWTHSDYRRQGIAGAMMNQLLENLQGQHVYLFSDDRVDFYKTLGFMEQPIGLSKVVGTWLVNNPEKYT